MFFKNDAFAVAPPPSQGTQSAGGDLIGRNSISGETKSGSSDHMSDLASLAEPPPAQAPVQADKSSIMSMFGQAPAGGFGQQPGFGQPAPGFGQPAPGFGQPAFGNASPAFGTPASNSPAFGTPSASPAFGQPPRASPGFGQPAAGSPAFGQPAGFGQPAAPSAGAALFGGPPPPAASSNPFETLTPTNIEPPKPTTDTKPAKKDPFADLTDIGGGTAKSKQDFFKAPPGPKINEMIKPPQTSSVESSDPFGFAASVSDDCNNNPPCAPDEWADPFDTSAISQPRQKGPFDSSILQPQAVSVSFSASEVKDSSVSTFPHDNCPPTPYLPSPNVPPPPLPQHTAIDAIGEAPTPPPRPPDRVARLQRTVTIDVPSHPPAPPPRVRPVRQMTIDSGIPSVPPRSIQKAISKLEEEVPPPLPPRPGSASGRLHDSSQRPSVPVIQPTSTPPVTRTSRDKLTRPRPLPEGSSSPGLARPRPRPEGSVNPKNAKMLAPEPSNSSSNVQITSPRVKGPESSPIARPRPRPRSSSKSSISSQSSLVEPSNTATLTESQVTNVDELTKQTTLEQITLSNISRQRVPSECSTTGTTSIDNSPAVPRRSDLDLLHARKFSGTDRHSDSSGFDSRSHSELNFSVDQSDISRRDSKVDQQSEPKSLDVTPSVSSLSSVDPFVNDPFQFDSPGKADPFTSPDDPFAADFANEQLFHTKAIVSDTDSFGGSPLPSGPPQSESSPFPAVFDKPVIQDNFSSSITNDPFSSSASSQTECKFDPFGITTQESSTADNSDPFTVGAQMLGSRASKRDASTTLSPPSDPFVTTIDAFREGIQNKCDTSSSVGQSSGSSNTSKTNSVTDPFVMSSFESSNKVTTANQSDVSCNINTLESTDRLTEPKMSSTFSTDSFFNKEFDAFDFDSQGETSASQNKSDLKFSSHKVSGQVSVSQTTDDQTEC